VYWCLAQFCLQWVVHTQSRERLRGKYGLAAAPCSDCCVTFWCARWLCHVPLHACPPWLCIEKTDTTPHSSHWQKVSSGLCQQNCSNNR